jgi:hypothetical protein
MHIVVTSDDIPAELCLYGGSAHDLNGMKQLPLNLLPGSDHLGDSAYTDYLLEKMFRERYPFACRMESQFYTSAFPIAKLIPKSVHAVTAEGFSIKIIAFIWAYTFSKLYNL